MTTTTATTAVQEFTRVAIRSRESLLAFSEALRNAGEALTSFEAAWRIGERRVDSARRRRIDRLMRVRARRAVRKGSRGPLDLRWPSGYLVDEAIDFIEGRQHRA